MNGDVLLVVAGPDGPEVRTGRLLEGAEGGCEVRLERALGAQARSGGVLVVDTGEGRLAMLTAPVPPADAGSQDLPLRFVQPVERDDAWERFVRGAGR